MRGSRALMHFADTGDCQSPNIGKQRLKHGNALLFIQVQSRSPGVNRGGRAQGRVSGPGNRSRRAQGLPCQGPPMEGRAQARRPPEGGRLACSLGPLNPVATMAATCLVWRGTRPAGMGKFAKAAAGSAVSRRLPATPPCGPRCRTGFTSCQLMANRQDTTDAWPMRCVIARGRSCPQSERCRLRPGRNRIAPR